jgi:hypothetical protein
MRVPSFVRGKKMGEWIKGEGGEYGVVLLRGGTGRKAPAISPKSEPRPKGPNYNEMGEWQEKASTQNEGKGENAWLARGGCSLC